MSPRTSQLTDCVRPKGHIFQHMFSVLYYSPIFGSSNWNKKRPLVGSLRNHDCDRITRCGLLIGSRSVSQKTDLVTRSANVTKLWFCSIDITLFESQLIAKYHFVLVCIAVVFSLVSHCVFTVFRNSGMIISKNKVPVSQHRILLLRVKCVPQVSSPNRRAQKCAQRSPSESPK